MMDPDGEKDCFYSAEMVVAWQNTPRLWRKHCEQTILLHFLAPMVFTTNRR